MAELSPDMLARLRDEASASTVEGVLQTMEALDATLLTADGVK
jgi:hypothetical protein